MHRQAGLVSVQNYLGLFSFRLKDVLVHSVGVLGITEHRWHAPSNGKNAPAMAFNNKPVNDRGPMFQGNFKTTAIVVYL